MERGRRESKQSSKAITIRAIGHTWNIQLSKMASLASHEVQHRTLLTLYKRVTVPSEHPRTGPFLSSD